MRRFSERSSYVMINFTMTTRYSYLVLLPLLTVFALSGCLKTRAQLRDETEEASGKPVPAPPVQDVQSQVSQGSQGSPVSQGTMGSGYAIDELKLEFTRLEGRVEDLERGQKEGAAKLASADSETLKKLDERLKQLEQAQISFQEKFAQLQQEGTPTHVADPESIYKRAMSQYEDEEFEGAAEAFGNYLKLHKVKRPENATFLRGECFYKLKQYKKAIVEYSKFPEKYSRSLHMPEAMYKIGLSFDHLGMKEDARGFYQELIEKFPKSPQAKKALKKHKES